MNTAIQPKDPQLHYQQGPHVLPRLLDEANDRRYIAQEMLGQLQEDLRKFRLRCKTYKALAIAIADDARPLAGRRAARLLKAGWAPAMNNAGYVLRYDIGRRHIEGTFRICPNGPPSPLAFGCLKQHCGCPCVAPVHGQNPCGGTAHCLLRGTHAGNVRQVLPAPHAVG